MRWIMRFLLYLWILLRRWELCLQTNGFSGLFIFRRSLWWHFIFYQLLLFYLHYDYVESSRSNALVLYEFCLSGIVSSRPIFIRMSQKCHWRRHVTNSRRWSETSESLSFCGSMVLTNLSLQHNTIGTYQVLKCLADPLFVFIQSVFYKKHYPMTIKLTLIPMILGITLNSWFDLRYSQIGTFYALSAVVITAVYTVVSTA